MTKNTKILSALGVGLTLVVVLALVFGGHGDESDTFSWDLVSKGEIRETISASGEIQAKTKVNVGTSVMGEIKTLNVKDGQDVKAGELLVVIDQERLKQQLSQASAMLEGARKDSERLKAAMQRAEENTTRIESLFKQGLVSDEEYRQAKLNRESTELSFQSAKANVAQAQANVSGMQDALSKSVLRAPIAGRVTGLKAEKGETAIPGMSNLPGAVLMVISDMSEIMAEIKVNESEVVRVKPGQTAQVSVEALPGTTFQGTVYEVASASEKVGQDANLYRVKVLMEGDRKELDKLRPGMSARAVILTHESKDVLRVPLQAVLERDGTLEDAQKKGLLAPESRFVVMVVKDGKSQEKIVQTGIANTQYFEVKSGLMEGEKVLTGPVRKLKELKEKSPVKLKKKSDTEVEKALKAKKDAGKQP